MLRLYGPILQRDAATSLPLQESLRGLLRSIAMHESDSLKYAEQNMFSMNFLAGQHMRLEQQQQLLHRGNVATLDSPQCEVVGETENSKELLSAFRFDNIQRYILEHNLVPAPPAYPLTDDNNEFDDINNADNDCFDDEEVGELNGKSKRSKLTSSSGKKSASQDIEEEVDDDAVWTSNWVDDDDDGDESDIAAGDSSNGQSAWPEDTDDASNNGISSHLMRSGSSLSKSQGVVGRGVGGDRGQAAGSHFVKLNGYSVEMIDVQAALSRHS